MIKQFVNDIKLIGDLFNSFLIQKGVLKRRPLRSWYYKNREGIKFKLRKGAWDSAVIMETWWLKEYVKNLDDFEDGAIIIDSGAHLGSFSIFMASKLDKVKIYAFEPDPDNFNLLKENIKINHLEEKIFPFKFALSEKEGKKIKLNIHPDNLGMHSTVFSYENLREEKKNTQLR